MIGNGPKELTLTVLLTITIVVISIQFSLPCRGQEQDGSEELPPPFINVLFDHEEYHIDVEPGSNGLFMVSGICYCGLPPEADEYTYIEIDLRPSLMGIPVSDPPKLIFSRSVSLRSFSISGLAPIERSAIDDLKLVLAPKWEYSQSGQKGSTLASSCRVIIDQYSRLSMVRDVVTERTPVGDWRTLSFNVINEGNGKDRIYLEVDPGSDKIDAELDREFIDVEEKHTGEFQVQIRQSSGKPGIHLVEVRAWSRITGQVNETTYEVPFITKTSLKSFFTTPSQYLPVLSISLIILLVVMWVVLRKRLFPDRDDLKPINERDKVRRSGPLHKK